MADNINEGITHTVFDRDCEPRCREQLACSYAASRCSTDGVVQLIAEGEITFLSSVQYTTTEKIDANVMTPEEYETPTTIVSLYSVLLELFSQRRWLLPLPLTQPFTTYSLTTSSLPGPSLSPCCRRYSCSCDNVRSSLMRGDGTAG